MIECECRFCRKERARKAAEAKRPRPKEKTAADAGWKPKEIITERQWTEFPYTDTNTYAKPKEKTASDARLLIGECLWQGIKIGICTGFQRESRMHAIRGEGATFPSAIGIERNSVWVDLLHDPRDVIELYRVNALDGLLEIYNRKMDGNTIDPLRARLIPTEIQERMERDNPPGSWRLYFDLRDRRHTKSAQDKSGETIRCAHERIAQHHRLRRIIRHV